VITVSELRKRYRSTIAVDRLSFEVQSGRITGFLGPNGAGKSTTMRCMLGLDRPDAGRTLFDGRTYAELSDPLREVGALLDPGSVHPGRTARNHLRFLCAAGGLPRARVDEVIELVGLSEAADKRVGGFSLGMSQRVGLAVALLGDPETLILDEPNNGLDPEGIRWMRLMLRYLADQGRTIFVSSHVLSELEQTVDDLVVIGQGRLIAQSSFDEFLRARRRTAVRVRSPQLERLVELARGAGGSPGPPNDGAALIEGIAPERVGEMAAANGIVLHELSPVTESLEEAFLAATADAREFVAEFPGSTRAEAASADQVPGSAGSLPPPPPADPQRDV
jgi:ABC-2 type transport system ATP-binding protein